MRTKCAEHNAQPGQTRTQLNPTNPASRGVSILIDCRTFSVLHQPRYFLVHKISYCYLPAAVRRLTYYIVSSRSVFYSEFLIDDGFALGFVHILLVRDDGGLHFGNMLFCFGDEFFNLVVDAVSEHG